MSGKKTPRTRRTPFSAVAVVVGAAAIAISAVILVATTGSDGSPAATLAEAPEDEHGDGIPYPSVGRISASDARAMMQDGTAVMIDVRDSSAYEDQHISGALALPEAELATRLAELPREELIITYCA